MQTRASRSSRLVARPGHSMLAAVRGFAAILLLATAFVRPATAVDGSWNPIVEPDYLGYAGAVVDSAGGAMYLFGGSNRSWVSQNRLWRYDLRGGTGWLSLPPGPTPPAGRSGPALFHDPVRDRLVLAGFANNADVWTYPLANPSGWLQVPVSGAPLPAGLTKNMVYDPVEDRMLAVIFVSNGAPIQVWTLPLAAPTWSLLGTVPALLGVPDRVTMHYDAGGDQVLLDTSSGPSSVYLYRLSIRGPLSLTQLGDGGTPNYGHGAAIDSRRHRFLTFAGGDGWFDPESNQTFSLDLGAPVAWVNRTPPAPAISGRQSPATVYDPIGDRLLCFGGFHQILNPPFETTTVYYAEFWQQSFSTTPSPWSRVTLTPGTRQNPRMVFATEESCAVLFGGYDGLVRMDLWKFRGAPGTRSELVPVSGTTPIARDRGAVAYDSQRNRLVMFGGWNYPTRLNDVIGIQLGANPAWLNLTPAGPAPPARVNNQMVYDSVGDRFIVFGGSSASGSLNDAWALDASGVGGWQDLAPTGTPPSAREYATLIFDAVRNRVVLFGGSDGAPHNDLWELTLTGSPEQIVTGSPGLTPTGTAEWKPLASIGTPPPARAAHMAAYDLSRDRMLIHGGYGSNYLSDVWSVAFGDSLRWTQLSTDGETPPARADHALCYDPLGDRLIISQGVLGNFLGDHWSLTFPPALVDVPASPPRTSAMRVRTSPNPARNGLSFAFENSRAGATEIDWFDLSGRRLRSDRVTLDAGSSRWSVPGPTWARLRASGPGIVFYRVRANGNVITGKVLIVE